MLSDITTAAVGAVGVKPQRSAQKFLTSHAAVYNTCNTERHLVGRQTLRQYRVDTYAAWTAATIAA